jgi:hypothetical protein
MGLDPGTAYSYTVAAYDAANNVSVQSDPAGATTLASGGTDTTVPGAAGTVKLPQTGQATGDSAGDDGNLGKGVAWPTPRFINNSDDNTLTDQLTGLAWAPDGNLMPARDSGWDSDATADDGMVTWQHALDYVAKLNQENYLGHGDWRLPNRRELRSLVHYGQDNTASWLYSQGATTAQAGQYWTSTSYSNDPRDAWSVNMKGGQMVNERKTAARHVWPVRAGDGTYAAKVAPAATGQKACFDASGATVDCANTGQDGALQTGTAWPAPRFSDNGDGSLTDRLTRLVWPKEAKSPGPEACSPGTTKTAKTWQGALDYASCLNAENYLGHGDWRLPNVNELESLVNAGPSDAAAWLVSQGFSNVQTKSYWSSTSFYSLDPYSIDPAWYVDMRDGWVSPDYKTSSFFVWPVRNAQ